MSEPFFLQSQGEDAAGNQTQDALGNTYTYRSDGLITGSGGLTYSYDALGQRVRKAAGSSSTEYIYFGGQLLAMRDSSGNWTDRIYGPTGALATVPGTQAGQPTYRVSDHLGSLNYTLDPSGTINGASSVYPFGQMASNSTGDNFVFTDHERDTENNSDATLYRHYASAQGRWLSPDPSNGSYDLADPQSFNRYSYVNNRPITSVDELGLDDGDCTCPCSGGGGGDPGGGDDGSHFDPWHWLFGWPGPAPIYRNPNKGVSLATQLNALPGGDRNFFLKLAFNGQSTGASLGNSSVDFALAQQQANPATPFQVGEEWLTGFGKRNQTFHDGDSFTEMLRHHDNVQFVIKGVRDGSLPLEGDRNYNLGGVNGVGLYLKDYSTLLTGGATGNLAVTYLGGYSLHYATSNGVITFTVKNTSSLGSATHLPIFGYTAAGQRVFRFMNGLTRSGPMSPTTQTFIFHEHVIP